LFLVTWRKQGDTVRLYRGDNLCWEKAYPGGSWARAVFLDNERFVVLCSDGSVEIYTIGGELLYSGKSTGTSDIRDAVSDDGLFVAWGDSIFFTRWSVPENLKVETTAEATEGTIRIEWPPIPYAENYIFQWSTSPEFHTENIVTENNWVYLSLEPGTYYWRVKGVTVDGETEWSATQTLIIHPAPVPELKAVPAPLPTPPKPLDLTIIFLSLLVILMASVYLLFGGETR